MKKERDRRKKKKTGWIYSIICTALILIAGGGWILLEMQRREVSQQRAEIQTETERLEEQSERLTESRKALEEQNQKAMKEEQKESQEESGKGKVIVEVSEPLELTEMEGKIQGIIADRTATGEKWNVYVKKLSDGSFAKVGEAQLKAASLIKLYIMGAVYEQYDQLAAQYGAAQMDTLLASMITVSDNDAANELTRMLGAGDEAAGREQVNAYCQEKGYAGSSMGRMLLADSSAGENYTTAADCARFLFDIYQGRHPHADQMLNLLKQQQRTGKIPAGVPEGIETANKTGELSDVENDAAIIWADGQPYILCVMADQLTDTQAAREKIVALSSEIYNQIQRGE